MTENMYVNVTVDGEITDITNTKQEGNVIHVGVKYIVGKDAITFVVEGENLFVERCRSGIRLYRYQFSEPGDYMITPLFVDTYRSVQPLTRELYSYLKKNLRGKFYLEEDDTLESSYEVVFNSWIDRTFYYKYKIRINPQTFSHMDIMLLVYQIEAMEKLDLLAIHNYTKGQSFFVDDNAIKLLVNMNHQNRQRRYVNI